MFKLDGDEYSGRDILSFVQGCLILFALGINIFLFTYNTSNWYSEVRNLFGILGLLITIWFIVLFIQSLKKSI